MVARAEALARPLVIPALVKLHGFKDGLFAKGTGYQVRDPKPPAGFTSCYDYGKDLLTDLTKAERKKCVAIYALTREGDGLELHGRYKPAVADQDDDQRSSYTPPTPEEVAAQRREEGIDTWSARLAVGKFAGTPFEGRAFWPNSRRWADAIEEINDEEVLVAVLVKVTADQIAAQREAAATKYDEELAEAEAAKAAAQAEAAAAAQADGGDALGAAEAMEELEDDETDEVAE